MRKVFVSAEAFCGVTQGEATGANKVETTRRVAVHLGAKRDFIVRCSAVKWARPVKGSNLGTGFIPVLLIHFSNPKQTEGLLGKRNSPGKGTSEFGYVPIVTRQGPR